MMVMTLATSCKTTDYYWPDLREKFTFGQRYITKFLKSSTSGSWFGKFF